MKPLKQFNDTSLTIHSDPELFIISNNVILGH